MKTACIKNKIHTGKGHSGTLEEFPDPPSVPVASPVKPVENFLIPGQGIGSVRGLRRDDQSPPLPFQLPGQRHSLIIALRPEA